MIRGRGWKKRHCVALVSTLSVIAIVLSPRGLRGMMRLMSVHVATSSSRVVPPGVARLAVEVDAGSTHTIATVYRWDGGPDPRGVDEVASAREEIGIATRSPTEAGQLVKSVIERALRPVSDAGEVVTMAAVRATAGMRQLQQQDTKRASEVVAAVDGAVAPLVGDSYTGMRVISAKEEAALSWAATQFISGAFAQGQVARVGMAELGGTSVQVGFPEEQAVDAVAGMDRDPQRCVVKVGPRRHVLRTLAWEGFGASAVLQALTAALEEEGDGSVVQHPCLPRGYRQQGNRTTVEGSGNFGVCYQRARVYLRKLCQDSTRGGLPGVSCYTTRLTAPEQGRHAALLWFALSGFPYVTQFLAAIGLGLGDSEPSQNYMWTAAQLVQAGQRLCSMPWAQLESTANALGHPSHFTRMKCFQVAHVAALLRDVLGFANGHDDPSIRYVKHMHSVQLDWMLGAMLVDTSGGSVCDETEVVTRTHPHDWASHAAWAGTAGSGQNRASWRGDVVVDQQHMYMVSGVGLTGIGFLMAVAYFGWRGEGGHIFGGSAKSRQPVGAAFDPNERLKRVSSLSSVWDAVHPNTSLRALATDVDALDSGLE